MATLSNNPKGSLVQENKLCWMRQIEVRLTSKITKKTIIFGGKSDTQLNIVIKGNKYLSALKDNGLCSISNLTYAQIVELIIGEYYDIEIWAGYRSQNQLMCYFSGAVSYISDKIQARRDNTCHILFASKMVASYSQKRMNLNLNSGINLYAAFNYICLTNGIDTSHLSPTLKNEFLQEVTNNYGTPATLAEQLANNTNTYTIETDPSVAGGVINCSDLSDKRYIKINPNTINFTKGNPTLDKDGLKITLLPTFCFKPGDIIIIDNAILDVSIADPNNVSSTFKTNYIDSNGAYMIMELDYNFTNREKTFEINIRARALNIIANITGAKV